MVDMAMISGAMSALKAVGDSAKAMVAIHDAGVLRSKVAELNTQIVAAQTSTLAALSDQFALLERVRELEKQVTDFEAWEDEQQRYQLEAVTVEAFAYALKPDTGSGEPPHWLCTTCYSNRKKSIMQAAGPAAQTGIESRLSRWKCPVCPNTFRVPYNVHPGSAKPKAS